MSDSTTAKEVDAATIMAQGQLSAIRCSDDFNSAKDQEVKFGRRDFNSGWISPERLRISNQV